MEILDNIAEFEFHGKGKVTGQTYHGKFRVKCVLTVLEEIQADKIYRNLLGDNLIYASQEIRELAFALSQLNVRVIEGPYFWKDLNLGKDFQDKNILFELLNMATEAQVKYLEGKGFEFEKKKENLTNMLESGEIEEDVEEENENEGVE